MTSGGGFSGAALRSEPKFIVGVKPKVNNDEAAAFEATLAANHRTPNELPVKPSIAKPVTGGLAGKPVPDPFTNVHGFQSYDPNDTPMSSTNLVVASRRSGKSVLINWILQVLQKKKFYTHIFLISASGASFKGIPKRFRGKSLGGLHWIVQKAREIGKYNKKQKRQSDMHHSRVAVVIDDMGHLGDLHKSDILKEIAMIGRHIAYPTGDSLKTNSFSLYLLTQSLTSVSPAFRRNCDQIFINNIASSNELNVCLEESGWYNFCQQERRRDARHMFQELIREKPFRFICIQNWKQPKTDVHDFFKLADADAEFQPDKQLFGSKSDNESDGDD